MTRLRDLLVLVLTASALGLSLILFGGFAGFTSPWFVLLAMFDFLGLLRVARPFVLLRLPRPLRTLRAWELEGDVYRAMGVPAFGALLRRTALRHLNPHVYLSGPASAWAAVCVQVEHAEAAHLSAIVLTVPYLVYAGLHDRWSVVFLFLLAHAAANVYPALHLRLVRGRLERALARTACRGQRAVVTE